MSISFEVDYPLVERDARRSTALTFIPASILASIPASILASTRRAPGEHPGKHPGEHPASISPSGAYKLLAFLGSLVLAGLALTGVITYSKQLRRRG